MRFSLYKYLLLPVLTTSFTYSFSADASNPESSEYFWPNGVVPYIFKRYDFSPDQQNKIVTQMRHLEGFANIKFKEVRENFLGDHVKIINGRGDGKIFCSSLVGKNFPGQELSLPTPLCLEKKHIIHELMHILGFDHEQNRYDRDEHIIVNLNNINEKCKPSFDKSGPESMRFGAYDIKSIMQYGSLICSINDNSPTILKRDSYDYLYLAEDLSEGDKEGLIKAYGPPLNETQYTRHVSFQ